eukprot:3225223-Rhodomonas_salina.4
MPFEDVAAALVRPALPHHAHPHVPGTARRRLIVPFLPAWLRLSDNAFLVRAALSFLILALSRSRPCSPSFLTSSLARSRSLAPALNGRKMAGAASKPEEHTVLLPHRSAVDARGRRAPVARRLLRHACAARFCEEKEQ